MGEGFSSIKSEFIRKAIKGAPFTSRRRAYVEDLMLLEAGILSGSRLGGAGHMHYLDVQERYPRAWKTIYLELDPKGFKEEQDYDQREKQKQAKENAKQKKQEQKERQKQRNEWKKMGGTG